MPILNYTTTVSAESTAAAVQKILARARVERTSTHYDEHGEPDGLAFTLRTPHGLRDYQMPIQIEGVLRELKKDRNVATRYRTEGQARRVAWRIAKDWLEAQLAIIAAGMVTVDEVMLPYLLIGEGRTMYDAYVENEQKAIGR